MKGLSHVASGEHIETGFFQIGASDLAPITLIIHEQNPLAGGGCILILRAGRQQLSDGVEKLLLINRFVEESFDAGFDASCVVLSGVCAGQEHNGNVFGFFNPANPGNDQESIPGDTAAMRDVRGKDHVEEDEVGCFEAGLLHGGSTILCCDNRVTSRRKDAGGGSDDDTVIVDNKYFLLAHVIIREWLAQAHACTSNDRAIGCFWTDPGMDRAL